MMDGLSIYPRCTKGATCPPAVLKLQQETRTCLVQLQESSLGICWVWCPSTQGIGGDLSVDKTYRKPVPRAKPLPQVHGWLACWTVSMGAVPRSAQIDPAVPSIS